jgi:hypothetical protein
MMARLFCMAFASLVMLPDIAVAQEIKLRAALQVTAADPFRGEPRAVQGGGGEADRESGVHRDLRQGSSMPTTKSWTPFPQAQSRWELRGSTTLQRLPAIDIIQQPFLFNSPPWNALAATQAAS